MSEMQAGIMDKNIQKQARQEVGRLVFGARAFSRWNLLVKRLSCSHTYSLDPLLAQLWDSSISVTRTGFGEFNRDQLNTALS